MSGDGFMTRDKRSIGQRINLSKHFYDSLTELDSIKYRNGTKRGTRGKKKHLEVTEDARGQEGPRKNQLDQKKRPGLFLNSKYAKSGLVKF